MPFEVPRNDEVPEENGGRQFAFRNLCSRLRRRILQVFSVKRKQDHEEERPSRHEEAERLGRFVGFGMWYHGTASTDEEVDEIAADVAWQRMLDE